MKPAPTPANEIERRRELHEFGLGEVGQWRPEVLALDAHLPGMTGYDRST